MYMFCVLPSHCTEVALFIDHWNGFDIHMFDPYEPPTLYRHYHLIYLFLSSLDLHCHGIIRIVSPNEGIIMDVSKVMRSQEFKGRKNSPKYALFASDGKEMSFWGAQNTLLGWYRNLDDISREIGEIQKALDTGVTSYVLQYSVKCKQNLFRTIEE